MASITEGELEGTCTHGPCHDLRNKEQGIRNEESGNKEKRNQEIGIRKRNKEKE